MVSLASLWLPILVSAVAVFIISAIVHMVLPYHKSDYAGLPNEDEVADAIRRGNAAPREYMIPYGGGMEAMKDPAFVAKLERGPVAFINVQAGRSPGMGGMLAQWFVFVLVVSIFVAYITSRAVGDSTESAEIVRFAGATAFIAYVMAEWPLSIWYGRPISTAMKNTFDGLLYAAATAAVFCFLWPR
jgi:hypothetical protein